ncbi:MAG TPA: ABC transporter permease subunit [Verrucomicrobiae bacterium]|nr:ABC transporter permease subunit [Verrucomicrobiae bacterium]
MIGIHLPIAAREIRAAAHNRGLYRGRAAIAGTALIATSWIFFSMFGLSGPVTSVGQNIFAVQAIGGFLFACGAFVATADSISREKRDGTLGLLFLTHLKARDVVLGKLVASMTLFVAGALAATPILTLPILMGGIQLSQALYLLASLLNAMLLSAAAGLFASSISYKKERSAAIAMVILLVFCGIIPLTVLGCRKGGMLETAYMLQFFTPLYGPQLAMGAITGVQVGFFWASFAIIFAVSLLLLAAASLITPRTWQQRAKEPFSKRIVERYAAWTLRTIQSRSPLGREMLDRNAYEWLAARKLSAAHKAWVFIATAIIVSFALILNFIRHNDTAAVLITVCVPAAYILQISVKIRIGGHACDRFAHDCETDAMELLLCTPLTIREMIAAEFRALRRHYLWPLIAAGALLFLALGLSLGGLDNLSQLFSESPKPHFRLYGLAVVACAFLILWVDSIAVAWSGMFCALLFRKSQHARGYTMFFVFAAPFFLCVTIAPLIAQSALARQFAQDAGFTASLLAFVVFVVVWDLAVIVCARRWLLRSARKSLTDPQIHSRAQQAFFGKATTARDSKAPLIIRNAAKAR